MINATVVWVNENVSFWIFLDHISRIVYINYRKLCGSVHHRGYKALWDVMSLIFIYKCTCAIYNSMRFFVYVQLNFILCLLN